MTLTTRPDALGHFGPYGGWFVPEALIVAPNELTGTGLKTCPYEAMSSLSVWIAN